MGKYPILEQMTSPTSLKQMDDASLDALAGELRGKILETTAKNGGHLASNLGVVEATLAIHRVFSLPEDRLIFDVGHQCYAHKLLTGRFSSFDSLRQENGISGFLKRSESEFDPFGAGHCGTALSAAVGFARADRLAGRDTRTVALIGDGSFTNGMVYEALNNCEDKSLRLILILNENDMSISPNVGALSRYLSRIRVSSRYFSFKHGLQNFLKKIPLFGEKLIVFSRGVKNLFKRMFLTGNFFEHLGVNYIGPVDGNDRKKLESVLAEAKRREGCTLVHIITKKGKGYAPAEEHPEQYHSVGAFDPEKGVSAGGKKETFSSLFGSLLCEEAEKEPRLCGVTAAMTGGTGMTAFAEKYPDRFFDVGIAEEHAMTFCCGLAAGGYLPVYAVYSTFAQRIFDQVLHDCLLQKLHVVLCLDRAGLVPGDGATHQGICDVALFGALDGVSLYAPTCLADLRPCLEKAIADTGCAILRYPRGSGFPLDLSLFHEKGDLRFFGGGKKVVVTYGRLTANALIAAKNTGAKLISLLRVAPIDFESLFDEIGNAEALYLPEEGIDGGMAARIAAEAAKRGFRGKVFLRTLPSVADYKGNEEQLFQSAGLDAASLTAWIAE